MKEFLLKRKVFFIFGSLFGLIFGLTLVTYAGTYNSSEITYDNSVSHAEATNVKDAIDWLYSHGFSTCPEDMTCIESPVVTINSSGPGSVDKESMHVRINGNNKFTVTPNSGFTLNSITCDNGYTLGTFNISNNSTLEEASAVQEITITNPGISDGATCNVYFGSYDIYVSSLNLHPTYSADSCNRNSSGCICYQIKNNVTNFTYGSHTGCNFKSRICRTTSYYGENSIEEIDCNDLTYGSYHCYGTSVDCWRGLDDKKDVVCSAVITCET